MPVRGHGLKAFMRRAKHSGGGTRGALSGELSPTLDPSGEEEDQ